ncbi:Cysteine protease ATG4D [Taenia crassiceps]|uniref:Cysteine protease n=1 Tax=Taenia crassiceps TaxID=6207 RepID=A0ABR4QHA8_9CEST
MEEDSGVIDLIRSVWNQMRFGWNVSLTPRLLPGLLVHFLGKKYFNFSNSEVKHNVNDEMEAFLEDFQSRLWFTYRDSFPPLSITSTHPIIPSLESPDTLLLNTTAALRSHLRRSVPDSAASPTIASKISHSTRVSDCGWGCMLRSVQMLAAQALLIHFLGRDWTYKPHNGVSAQEPKSRLHRRIIRWFADAPSSPLSIHQLVQTSGSPPGTHFGPAAVCQALLVAMACAEEAILKEFEIYLAHDRVICDEAVLALFEEAPPNLVEECLQNSTGHDTQDQQLEMNASIDHISNSSVSPLGDSSVSHVLNTLTAASSPMEAVDWKSELEHRLGVLILLPMRLGAGNRIEADHLPTLLRLLEDPSCVGLIGGRPRHSVYVAGVQSDRLIYLDPHFCQEAVDISVLSDDDEFDVSTWHCSTPRIMRAQRLDPSLALGFYCGSRDDAISLLHRLPIISESEISSTVSSHHLIEVVTASQVQHLFAPLRFSDPHPPSDDAEWDGVQDDGDTCLVDL